MLDQVGELDRAIAATRVLEVDDADARAVPQVVGQVRVAVRDDRVLDLRQPVDAVEPVGRGCGGGRDHATGASQYGEGRASAVDQSSQVDRRHVLGINRPEGPESVAEGRELMGGERAVEGMAGEDSHRDPRAAPTRRGVARIRRGARVRWGAVKPGSVQGDRRQPRRVL